MASIISTSAPWIFVAVFLVVLGGVMYGLFTDSGSGITTRVREDIDVQERMGGWRRGTR
jgi:hypothetical protein